MGLILVFLLGMGNFAVHKAVLESDHPMLGRALFFSTCLAGDFHYTLNFLCCWERC